MDSQIIREQFQGSKSIGLKSFLYHWKALGTYMSKMGLHDPFGHLTQIMAKRRFVSQIGSLTFDH
jgi:hypothetical protein